MELIENVRSDIFLLSINEAGYQRSGAFLSISFILLSILYNFATVVNKIKKSIFNKIFFCFCFVVYIGNCLEGMLLAQLFGSNKSMVIILGLMIITIIFQLFIRNKYNRIIIKS